VATSEEQQQQQPLPSLRLEAVFLTLLAAETDEQLREARKVAAKIRRMSDEDVEQILQQQQQQQGKKKKKKGESRR
jgi:hypothetical protein